MSWAPLEGAEPIPAEWLELLERALELLGGHGAADGSVSMLGRDEEGRLNAGVSVFALLPGMLVGVLIDPAPEAEGVRWVGYRDPRWDELAGELEGTLEVPALWTPGAGPAMRDLPRGSES